MARVETHYTNDGQVYFSAHGYELAPLSVQDHLLAYMLPFVQTKGEGKSLAIGGAATLKTVSKVAEQYVIGTFATINSVSTAIPEVVFAEIKMQLQTCGIPEEKIVHIGKHTLPEEAKRIIQRSSLCYLTGGDQHIGMRELIRTGVDKELRESHRNGNTIAGTSAGTAMLGSLTAHGPEDIIKGLGIESQITYEQHLRARNRIGRLTQTVTKTGYMGIGVDEDTLIAKRKAQVEVFGTGGVILVKREDSGKNIIQLKAGESYTIAA